MKKNYVTVLIVMISLATVNAQKRISFGATGGLFYGSAHLSVLGVDITSILDLFNATVEDLEVLEGGGFI
jgi:hypothetical protein